MKRGTTTRRLTAAAGAVGLVLALAGCDVSFDGKVSQVSITRTCKGEADHVGSSDYRTQVLVTADPANTEDHHIFISLNGGAETSGKADAGPGDGVAHVTNTLNTTLVEVAVVPSDGSGDFDIVKQSFNPC